MELSILAVTETVDGSINSQFVILVMIWYQDRNASDNGPLGVPHFEDNEHCYYHEQCHSGLQERVGIHLEKGETEDICIFCILMELTRTLSKG